MKKTTIFLFLILISNVTFGQNNYEQFKKLFKENDTIKIKTLLSNWEKTNPDDAELYTSAFNYYFSRSKQEVLSIQKEQTGKESLQLTDSIGNVAGFMNSNLSYDSEKLEKAFIYINKGIEKFPNRLDLRFGKCYVLGELGEYEKFTQEIIKTVTYSKIINNEWLWTENVKKENSKSFMLQAIQAYLKQLYDTEDDNLLINMIEIGDVTLKYYPDNIEILSTTSVAYMLTKNYDKAITYLKQAEQLNPKDFIVLNNIAQGYKLKGDNENAIKYYLLTAKYGDEQAKQTSKSEIDKLKK